jgi:hypothetical protein
MKKPRKKKSLASSWEGPFLFMKYLDNNGFRSKIKVAGFVLLRARMKNCGTTLGGICKFFMLHFEMVMIKGLSQKNLGVVTDVIEKDGWEVLGVTMKID